MSSFLESSLDCCCANQALNCTVVGAGVAVVKVIASHASIVVTSAASASTTLAVAAGARRALHSH